MNSSLIYKSVAEYNTLPLFQSLRRKNGTCEKSKIWSQANLA